MTHGKRSGPNPYAPSYREIYKAGETSDFSAPPFALVRECVSAWLRERDDWSDGQRIVVYTAMLLGVPLRDVCREYGITVSHALELNRREAGNMRSGDKHATGTPELKEIVAAIRARQKEATNG